MKRWALLLLALLPLAGNAQLILRQSTASQAFLAGPFVDEEGAPVTSLTIANTDVRLSKNGAASGAKNSGGCTHDAGGYYICTLDATDTNTVGRLQLFINESGALGVYHQFQVLPAEVFDRDYASTATGYLADYVAASGSATGGTDTTVTLGAAVTADDVWNRMTFHNVTQGFKACIVDTINNGSTDSLVIAPASPTTENNDAYRILVELPCQDFVLPRVDADGRAIALVEAVGPEGDETEVTEEVGLNLNTFFHNDGSTAAATVGVLHSNTQGAVNELGSGNVEAIRLLLEQGGAGGFEMLWALVSEVTSQTQLILNSQPGSNDRYNGHWVCIDDVSNENDRDCTRIIDYDTTDGIRLEGALDFTVDVGDIVHILPERSLPGAF